MVIRTIFIDDLEDDRHFYAEELSRDGKLSITSLPPPSVKDFEQIINTNADLYLIDLLLTKGLTERRLGYLGTIYLSALRQYKNEYPLVLLTRKSRLRNQLDKLPNLASIVDDIIFKDEIDEKGPSETINRLVCLTNGFRKLRDYKRKDLVSFLRALNAERGSEAEIMEGDPPLGKSGLPKGEWSYRTGSRWNVTELVHWILRVLMEFPGILYDSLHAATSLGLSKETFLRPEIQELFSGTQYEGVFDCLGKFWWRNRLHYRAFEIIGDDAKELPLYQAFPEACRNITDQLELSRCTWSGKSPANQVCFILKEPVLTRYSLPYNPDDRPPIMDSARVSFRAIREKSVRKELLDPLARSRLKKIHELPEIELE